MNSFFVLISGRMGAMGAVDWLRGQRRHADLCSLLGSESLISHQ